MKRLFYFVRHYCVPPLVRWPKRPTLRLSSADRLFPIRRTTFLVPSTSLTSTIKTDHHLFYEGTLGIRLLDAKAASLHVELPVAGIPSQTLKFANVPIRRA